MVAKYSPYDENLLARFEKRFTNLVSRASRISEFKKAVIAAYPDILQIRPIGKFNKDGKSHAEYNKFVELKPADQYREWTLAKKSKTKTPWQRFLSQFTLLP